MMDVCPGVIQCLVSRVSFQTDLLVKTPVETVGLLGALYWSAFCETCVCLLLWINYQQKGKGHLQFWPLFLLLKFTFHLGFVQPLQDVALHQCLPLSSFCCFPVSDGSLPPCYVILPSSTWSSPWSLPSPWLPLWAAFGPPIVLHSCYMPSPSPLLFQCVFYNVNNLCSFLIS